MGSRVVPNHLRLKTRCEWEVWCEEYNPKLTQLLTTTQLYALRLSTQIRTWTREFAVLIPVVIL